jgi:hypothetical protein
MENIVLILIASIPGLIQFLGYYLSIHFKQSNKIRWIVFVVSMIVYYSFVYHVYQTILEKHYKCGTWIFLIIGLIVIGLTMPIMQLLISAYDTYFKKKK